MTKPTTINRNILTFVLALVFCFGCSKPEVVVQQDPGKTHGSEQQTPHIQTKPAPKSRTTGLRGITANRYSIISTARAAVGIPYVWGGLSPKGFDCSGLVVYSYSQIGIHVPRTARAQLKASKPVSRQNIRPGDLVFFEISRRRGSIHVGIYVGGGRFVHAPGRGRKVKYAMLDNVYFKRHFIRAGNFFRKEAG